MEAQYTKAYTIKEVSKILNVPPGTLRQWEKDLKGLLVIPRTNQGARFYTDLEISLLTHIKQMRDKNLSKEIIREMMEKHLNQGQDQQESSTSLSIVPEQEKKEETNTITNIEPFLEAMEAYKQGMLQEVKEGIQTIIRNEVLPEVKKEIANGSLQTVKSLSGSIYKSSEKTSAEIKELANQLDDRSELTSEQLETLSKKVSNVSKGTSEQVKNVLKQLAKSNDLTSKEMKILLEKIESNKEDTRNELTVFAEMMTKEREYLLDAIQQDRIELNQEIKNREETFQGLVDSFRESAAAKNKKNWWKFWG